ncbi:MAG: ATP-binding cassette domain-containing protein [Chitinivibrionales bacterium]|nr:ATP-binding cassette domain-containing protein [Chitinivibrionales bacterium]
MNDKVFALSIQSGKRVIVATDQYRVVPNAVTFLFGESGIGKSLLTRTVYGLTDTDELDTTVNNAAYRSHLSSPWTRQVMHNSFFVFQEPSSHLNPLIKLNDQLHEGSLAQDTNEKHILDTLWEHASDKTISAILELYPKPYRPSGGEKQRILLAMAFKKINVFQQSTNPEVPSFFVFDEPTGSLDNNYRNVFLKLLFDKFRQRPFTVMLITHDYSIISEIEQHHADLTSAIHYKELYRRAGSNVAVRSFKAKEYTTWLQQSSGMSAGFSSQNIVLNMQQSFRVFERSLHLFADPAHRRPADLCIRKGEMVYLKAPSGVGKTTLAKIVMGLLKAQHSSLSLSGLSLNQDTPVAFWHKHIWGKKAGMIFQHADEALNLQATVKETFKGLPTRFKMSDKAIAAHLKQLFDISITPEFLNKKVAWLSGGQKQRLNILRTLALDTDLIILDEPLNGLDFASIRKVLSLLEQKRRSGKALLMISHNEEIFDTIVGPEHVVYLREGADA